VKNLKTGIMRNKHTHEDGTPFTKEEFLQKLKTDKEFNDEFGNKGIDQISELIKQLKETPDSRRMVVNAWAVHDLPNMVLPPCHYGFQVYTRELSLDERLRLVNYDKEKFNSIDEWITWYNNEPNEFYYMGINYTKDTALTDLGVPTRAISLMWNQRSADVLLGLPFNIASYGLLLEIIAKAVNMVPDELIGNLGDVHLYSNHIKQAKEQLTREPMKLPKLKLGEGPMEIVDWQKTDLDTLLENMSIHRDTCFQLENYQSHPTIKAPLSN
jgi:thymidylate synthase